jgi:DNA-binding NtrC family response regulator
MSAPDISAATNATNPSRPAVTRIEALAPREHGVESRRGEPPNGTGEEPESAPGSILQGAPQNDSELEVILGDLDISSSSSRLITVDELERRYIERVLAVTSGNKSRAAQILGFDRRTLYRKIERYGRSS